MDLTKELKATIDSKSYESLLFKWRFAPVGDPMFQGESGEYWKQRLSRLKDEYPAGAVVASKKVGWL